MNKIAYAAVFVAFTGITGVATAADLGSLKDAPEYVYSPAKLWTGLYIGGHIGGAWGKTNITDTFDYHGDPVVKSNVDGSGIIGGIQLGYNVQRGNVVFGIEADLGRLDISGNKSSKLLKHGWVDDAWQWGLNSDYSVSSSLYGDLALRLGMTPTKNSLVYLKGGPAFLNVDYNAHYVGQTYWGQRSFDFSHSDTMWGWTIGAGVEYALSPALSVKAEYQHFDFGKTSFQDHGEANAGLTWLDTKVDLAPTVDAVSVGLNYKLGADRGLK